MAERKRIGIFLFDGVAWAGGYYYVLSTIKAFNVLPDNEKPHITVFYFSKESLAPVIELKYPYINYLPIEVTCTLAERIVNKITRTITGKNIFSPKPYNRSIIDYIFPYNYLTSYPSLENLKKIYWIPDFQHLYYPDFFSEKLLKRRGDNIKNISEKSDSLVLSSQSAFNDYKKYYPNYRNKIFVVTFASMLPDITSLNWDSIAAKHRINGPYFFSPNQFWKHKNHIVVLKAVKLLKAKNINITVLFSGHEDDPRDKEYVNGLKKYILDNDLTSNIRFLGFLDRKEQLKILQNALAVIQPSLFEGWSTVVEDSKALNQFVIASALDVHKEQLKNNCLFFDPLKEEALAHVLEKCLEEKPLKHLNDYGVNILHYATLLKSLSANSQD
jgi:glycosyltransferase involved in cell wall biosynthesis